MDLNNLETQFFDRILNASPSTKVRFNVKYQNNSIEVYVIPTIADDTGYFTMKYHVPFKHDPTSTDSWTLPEDAPLLLKQAWKSGDLVQAQQRVNILSNSSRVNPTLHVKIHIQTPNKGELILEDNQITIKDSILKRTEFCILDFPDFKITEEELSSSEYVGRQIILCSSDGWKITLRKDSTWTRGQISHIGVIERDDCSEYGIDELVNVLEGLKYFFAFVSGVYHHPTVVIGYDSCGLPAWGTIGKFKTEAHRCDNWFYRDGEAKAGIDLETLFPLFWTKWTEKRNELVAIAECYVHSNVMRKAGISSDAVAKSYAGLEILSSLWLNKTITKDSRKKIYKALSEMKIPNLCLSKFDTPIMARLSDKLDLSNYKGPYLLNSVRNYIPHPLDNNPQQQNDEKPSPVVKEKHLKYLDSDWRHYLYLHDLSQFYLEYSLLRFCGYEIGSDLSKYRPLRDRPLVS